ncbi:unnamed protein product [Sphagnum balticum]
MEHVNQESVRPIHQLEVQPLRRRLAEGGGWKKEKGQGREEKEKGQGRRVECYIKKVHLTEQRGLKRGLYKPSRPAEWQESGTGGAVGSLNDSVEVNPWSTYEILLS